jgi:imidazolonepropionase-like amidohydrolase
MQAILGAVLIDGAGGPPLSNSIVIVSGGVIRAAGSPSAVLIPGDADKINGSGKFLIPAPMDLNEGTKLLRPGSPEQARSQVAERTAGKSRVIHMAKLAPEVAEAVLEAARAANIPVIGRISTQEEAKFLVAHGVSGFTGMIRDTENLDPDFVANLRNLKIFFAPALTAAGPSLEVAKRNTLRLFQAGVPIAVAAEGGDRLQEMRLLSSAGLPPLDVIVAATRNTAAALRRDDSGTIAAGKRADLLLLSANPGEDIGNLAQVALRIAN